jgi:hypothetical protein
LYSPHGPGIGAHRVSYRSASLITNLATGRLLESGELPSSRQAISN